MLKKYNVLLLTRRSIFNQEEREKDIEVAFKKHIKENGKWKFLRLTWESIYTHISKLNPASDREMMTRFFKDKTIGYRNGALQKAFQIT